MSNIGNKESFAKNLKHYIKASGKDRKVICEELGFPYSTMTEWLNAKKYPRIDRIEKLADYFGIMKSDLIEEKLTKEEEKNNDAMVDIVFKMRTDKEFYEAVSYMYMLDSEKLSSVKQMLTVFLK